MFVLITSKMGEYQAEPESGLTPVKHYDYYFYNKKKAEICIARVDSDSARVRITEVGDRGARNSIPIKFFESFDSLQHAEKELQHLASSTTLDVALKEQQRLA
jgi:hypothetical protein